MALESLEVRVLLTTFTVNTLLDVVDAGDGVTSLREAIQMANADAITDDIEFSAGLNGGTITLGGTELAITESVNINGPGSGLLTIDANDASRIFDADGDINVSISGLTLTNGFTELIGGGAIISNANLSLDDVVVMSSMSGDPDSFTSAGGLFQFTEGLNDTRTLTINNSVFTGNSARGRGGAMYLEGQISALITNSVISNNSALYEGGAIHTFFEEADLDLQNLTLDIIDSTLDNNMSTSTQGRGGAIYNAGSTINVLNSTVSNNFARTSGGAFYGFFTDNIFTTTFPQTNVINSTVSGNSTNGDGGVNHGPSGYLFINSTLVNNRADADGMDGGTGGGVWGTVEAHNTIIAGNVIGAGAGTPNDASHTLDNSTFNLIGDANSSGGLTDGVDGNIVGNGGVGTIDLSTVINSTLADNGGPTLTHALVTGSPALNAGSNPQAVDENSAPLTGDQRGFPRIADAIVDIGAVEGIGGMPAFIGDSYFSRANDGTLMIYANNGSQLQSFIAGDVSDSVDWDDFRFGDFNGDGFQDISGKSPSDGKWRVLLNNGNGTFSMPDIWDTWSTNVTFTDLLVGDFDNNGLDDVAGRASTGSWILGLSNGSEFVTASYGAWSTNVTWSNVLVGDFNNDGRDDIAGFSSNNTWWVAEANGTRFVNDYYGAWSQNVTWSNVHVGDFNGDNFDDIVGRASTGTVVVGSSTGDRFAMASAGILNNNLIANPIGIGDFNDDGKDDLLARATSGSIVVGVSNGTTFQLQTWGARPTNIGYTDNLISNANDDAFLDYSDINNNGDLYAGISDGTQFTRTFIGNISNIGSLGPVTVGTFV